jgi:hypothetical protein
MHRYRPGYRFIAVALAVLVLLSIWLPPLAHYHVDSVVISDEVVRRARLTPVPAVLDELAGYKFAPGAVVASADSVAAADLILRGRLRLPGHEEVAIGLPFDPRDLERGLPTWQLLFASMAAPDMLMDAYVATGKQAYLAQASDIIVAWAGYERTRWLPRGFLWNDHALAGRVAVLARFWSLYRQRPDFQPEVARTVLALAARSGAMLAKGSGFTFATNHGVMQNLALLHLAAAFPSLPGAASYRRAGFERLRAQMRFYVDDEGVVLEHSAGYHGYGMELLGKAFRYLALNQLTAPLEWIAKYDKSKQFMATIRRPDGSLPMFGNTDGSPGPAMLATEVDAHGAASPLAPQADWPAPAAHTLYPLAGYSVWWDKPGAEAGRPQVQSVMAWSHFPGHGHKLADEMSLLLWADRQTWLTSVGYWPYGVWGRDRAASWEGSNAPHLSGEAADSARRVEQLAYAADGRLAFNHLRRSGPAAYMVERQVLHLDADLWLVFDRSTDQQLRKASTAWTFFPGLKLTAGAAPGQFQLSSGAGGACLGVWFAGTPALDIRRYQGSRQPFAGWVVVGGRPTPAPALRVEQASDGGALLTLLALEADCQPRLLAAPKLTEGASGERWQVELPLREGALTIRRDGKILQVGQEIHVLDQGGARAGRFSKLDIANGRAALTDAFASAAARYPSFRDLIDYRRKVSFVLLALLAGQETLFALWRRHSGRAATGWRLLAMAAWVAGGAWLALVYFNPS